MIKEIGIETARLLIDFSGQQSREAAWEQQLKGAVALHNVLVRENIAYLADEVGMGKTYVALGVAALFRHYKPDLRVLYIVPRGNIQLKWKKELLNFTAKNWRVTDNRVRSFQGSPACGLTLCESLIDLARQAALNSNRDFLMRMTSFSLGLSGDTTQWAHKRDELLQQIPWLDRALFDLRADKEAFKDNYARAINCIMPHFDLVVIDEGHNLKHGLQDNVATRNRLIAYSLGHPCGRDPRFPHYGCRFDRVLILSATPLESDYRELWNQLDLFDHGNQWSGLRDPDASDDRKEELAKHFLVRRLTGLTIGGQTYTKNMYRREWRNGGVDIHDDPLRVPDERQRLIVALVQKKVTEVLGSERFNNSFQIGMLASFESFLETAGVKQVESDDASNFDNPEQTDEQIEREGIDTPSINRLARSYYLEFGESLPHPKMDAVAQSCKSSFETGAKTLVFVRRVRSVDELTEKLNRLYDEWLKSYLLANLPPQMRPELESAFDRYKQERRLQSGRQVKTDTLVGETIEDNAPLFKDEEDEGDSDSFFAWFFRGKGPERLFSGAAFNRNRLTSEGSAYSTFFEDNYVTWLLGETEDAVAALALQIGITRSDTAERLRQLAYGIFRQASRQKKFPRLRVFWAYQEAAVAMLANQAQDSTLRDQASVVCREHFWCKTPQPLSPPGEFPSPDEFPATRTFFTELAKRPLLRAELWPEEAGLDSTTHFRRREQRRELLLATARLGHPFIDLWLLAAKRLGTLAGRAQERTEHRAEELVSDYLDLLEQQRLQGMTTYTGFRELAEIACNLDLILAVNFPDMRDELLVHLPKLLGRALARQKPVGGMWGGVNASLVRQFRMPGYPLILVTTEVLQEGEDLHTFCSQVIHYGIAWTPSAMEQRTGRIDRIHSLTQRRLDDHLDVRPDEKLQVFYPHLQETVERLQVERVYERMNRFIRLMHRSIGGERIQESRINTLQDFVVPARDIAPITEPLTTAFDVHVEWLHPTLPAEPILAEEETRSILQHFHKMMDALEADVFVRREPRTNDWSYFGTVYVLPGERLARSGDRFIHPDDNAARPVDETGAKVRRQPIGLFLRTVGGSGHVLLHCASPIGVVAQDDDASIEQIYQAQQHMGKVCAVLDTKQNTYNLAAEGDVLFHPDTTQPAEVLDLVARVACCADRLERVLLRLDQPLEQFRADLVEEPKHAQVQ